MVDIKASKTTAATAVDRLESRDPLRQLRDHFANHERELEERHRGEIRELRDSHRVEMDQLRADSKKQIDELQQENSVKLNEKDLQHQKEIEAIKAIFTKRVMESARKS